MCSINIEKLLKWNVDSSIKKGNYFGIEWKCIGVEIEDFGIKKLKFHVKLNNKFYDLINFSYNNEKIQEMAEESIAKFLRSIRI